MAAYLQTKESSPTQLLMREDLIFIGNEKFATGVETRAPILNALLQSQHQVKAVIINRLRHWKAQPTIVEEIAATHGVPVHTIESNDQLLKVLENYPLNIAVLAAFGRILPESIIGAFRHGIINVHPSLLPQFRGPTPIEQALLEGLSKTGVSIMELTKSMDAGPVFKQWEVDIEKDESKQTLHDKLADSAALKLPELINDIVSGHCLPEAQAGEPTYTKTIDKSTGKIIWNKPAAVIEREVRAYAGWPGSQTQLGQVKVTITQAQTGADKGTIGEPFVNERAELGVYCGEGALIIERLKPQGKNEMAAKDFLNGYRRQIFG